MSYDQAYRGWVLPRTYKWFEDGAATGLVSRPGEGGIRYNDTAKSFQVSIDAAPYVDIPVGVAAGGPITLNSGGTPIGFADLVYVLGGGFDILEGHAQWIASRVGTFRNIFAQAFANTLDGAATISLRVNGAPSALILSVPALGTALVSDIVTTVTVAAGDLISLEVGGAGTLGSISGLRLGLQFGS